MQDVTLQSTLSSGRSNRLAVLTAALHARTLASVVRICWIDSDCESVQLRVVGNVNRGESDKEDEEDEAWTGVLSSAVAMDSSNSGEIECMIMLGTCLGRVDMLRNGKGVWPRRWLELWVSFWVFMAAASKWNKDDGVCPMARYHDAIGAIA